VATKRCLNLLLIALLGREAVKTIQRRDTGQANGPKETELSVVVIGVGLFVLAFAAHVAWWRRGRPRRSGQTLICLLTVVILVGWGVALTAASGVTTSVPPDIFAWLQALVLALALAASYVMTYPALEIESPTLVIIEVIAQRGNQGIEVDEFHRCLDDSVLVLPRIQDLVDEGLAVLRDGRYQATAKGLMLVRVFVAWRKILGAGLGG
jgi:hypothetical protein